MGEVGGGQKGGRLCSFSHFWGESRREIVLLVSQPGLYFISGFHCKDQINTFISVHNIS